MSFDLDQLGSVLVVTWSAVAVTERLAKRRAAIWAAVFGSAFCAFLPIDGLALHGYLRGHLGALSAASQLWLVLGIARRLGGPELPSARDRRALFAGVLAAALLLYPMSLGLSPYDPYRLGYSVALVALVGALALASWQRRLPVTTGALVLALFGYGLALGESTNLWDYLIDPWIASFAAVSSAAALTRFGLRSGAR